MEIVESEIKHRVEVHHSSDVGVDAVDAMKSGFNLVLNVARG